MKIIALSDLHNATNSLEALAKIMSTVNLIILAGDITNKGNTENISDVIRFIRKYTETIFAVPGNWDGQEVSEYLESENINIHRKHIIFGGVAFIGIGGSLISHNSPNEISEKDFELFLNQAVEGLDPRIPFVLVSHQPPIQTLTDKTWMNEHVGSKSIRSFIERTQPIICFTGHIHEGIGIDKIGDTKVINPGPVWKNQYAYAEITENQVCCLEIRTF